MEAHRFIKTFYFDNKFYRKVRALAISRYMRRGVEPPRSLDKAFRKAYLKMKHPSRLNRILIRITGKSEEGFSYYRFLVNCLKYRQLKYRNQRYVKAHMECTMPEGKINPMTVDPLTGLAHWVNRFHRAAIRRGSVDKPRPKGYDGKCQRKKNQMINHYT